MKDLCAGTRISSSTCKNPGCLVSPLPYFTFPSSGALILQLSWGGITLGSKTKEITKSSDPLGPRYEKIKWRWCGITFPPNPNGLTKENTPNLRIQLFRVYNRVWEQETWGPKHPFMDLALGLNIGHRLKHWFLFEGLCYWVSIIESCVKA